MSDVKLDPERQARAAQRARAALAAAEHHEAEAARERSKADSICRTWDIPQDKFGYPNLAAED